MGSCLRGLDSPQENIKRPWEGGDPTLPFQPGRGLLHMATGIHVPGARYGALDEMGLWNSKGAGRREKQEESNEFLAVSQPNSSDSAPGTSAGSASRRDRREPRGPRTFPSVSPLNPVHDSFFLRMISELSQLNLSALALPLRSAQSSSKNRHVNDFDRVQ